jgi:signal transduction histidine kinase
MDFLVAGCFLAGNGLVGVVAGPVSIEPSANVAAGVLRPWVAQEKTSLILAVYVALVLAGAVALFAWRRRHPVWLLLAVLGLEAVQMTGFGYSDVWLMLFALFALAQRTRARTAWIGLAATGLEVAMFSYLLGGKERNPSLIAEIAWYAIAMSIFVHLGNRRRYVAALVDRAEHLALERDQRAQIAVARERERIARELHDVVAHSMAVTVTLADGAAATISRDPVKARAAMETVSETGRRTVADMRRLLAVLRTEPDLAPQPGADQLLSLVESFRKSGLPVSTKLAAALPEDKALGLTVYRIIQESLTNVLRHAPTAAWVRVAISQPEDNTFQVLIENGPPSDSAGARTDWEGSGQGLVGMAQRVEVFGGTFEAGPTADGGWRVVAVLREE